MKQGFWQIPIREEDKEKTAFGTDGVIFEWNQLCYGLTGAPAVFQNCMNAVLGDVRHFALAFVDDIIVFSETYEDHLKHLQDVFDRLRKANLKLKISKCDFIKKRLNHLGHIISDEGISVDPDKVSVGKSPSPGKYPRYVVSWVWRHTTANMFQISAKSQSPSQLWPRKMLVFDGQMKHKLLSIS